MVRLWLWLMIGFVVLPFPAAGAEAPPSLPPPVVIEQLQVSGGVVGQAGYEFIELANVSTIPLALDGWLLQYRSASAAGDCTSGWSTKTTIASGVIAAGGSYLLAANGYLESADGRFAPGLADTKGAVRLVDAAGTQLDAVAWGGAPCGAGVAAPVPSGGQSLKRLPDHRWTGSNMADFALTLHPQPLSAGSRPAPVYAPLILSEIMPHGDDDNDPFIELVNPNDLEVQLSAYAMRVGTKVYHLAPGTVAAYGYTVVPLNDSGIVLTTGDEIELLDPAGAVIDRSANLPEPEPLSSWSLFETGWAWTNQVTPATLNMASVVDTTPAVTTLSAPSVAIEISELLPQPSLLEPVQRLKFVELHNIGTTSIALNGYSLKSGASWGNHAVVPNINLEPGAYLSLSSTVVPISLAVSGGRIGLFDAGGGLVGDAVVYPKAQSGLAYAKFSDGWHWTTFATPGAANVLVVPLAKAVPTKSLASTAITKKKAAATSKKAKAPKAKKVAKAPQAASFTLASATRERTIPLHWLLFGLGGLTMAYVIYEFRHDLNHHYIIARRDLKAWSARWRTRARRRHSRAEE